MAAEIKALEDNGTWVITDLPPCKRAVGCKGRTKSVAFSNPSTASKQASRNLFAKFSSALLVHGFQQSRADYSLFTRHCGTSYTAALVYVDDILLAGNDIATINAIKAYLHSQFHLKDLGVLKYFLGLEVARSPFGIFLSQRKYTLDILHDCGLTNAKPIAFPIEQNSRFDDTQGELLVDATRYRRLLGRLQYLTVTRLDILYVVNTLSQFSSKPTNVHWDAALHILRYIKATPGHGIFFRSTSSLQLHIYCDSDWTSCPTTRRSVTGYYCLLGDSPISWKSKR
ncbi:PREDICTED: uncharacterized protein LOC109114322 [Nelumbo nucifera]|uniref:Uncharacterized protein LOC109114322 n=1 Tax=Nelumbo nucifera TaxID=4432 RepID=A0A1U8Q0B0_NELNU|nr:PREDICTED: uncharacterized protein LOC109114322 [Nelumbo nucifera]